MTNFCLRNITIVRKKKKLAAVSRETTEIQGATSHKTLLVRGWLKNISLKSLKKSKGGSLKNFPKNLARLGHAFWELCLNLMNFF